MPTAEKTGYAAQQLAVAIGRVYPAVYPLPYPVHTHIVDIVNHKANNKVDYINQFRKNQSGVNDV
ncbi:hypothetical protein GCM10009098_25140 [Rheinheimera aquimaris]|uniref:Uncharacterized protein n=1 Tax=Rheinheimera aquimaris TaxID=412437 RepID=A0ABP3NYK9_9GAMM